jgi:hypothetical protein
MLILMVRMLGSVSRHEDLRDGDSVVEDETWEVTDDAYDKVGKRIL